MNEKQADLEEASQEDVVFVKSSEFTLERRGDAIRYNAFGNVAERGMFYAGKSRFVSLTDEDDEETTGISVSDIPEDDNEDERVKWVNLTNNEKGIRIFEPVEEAEDEEEETSLTLVAPVDELNELLKGEKDQVELRVPVRP